MTQIALCVATTGRPAILNEALADVGRQTRRPDAVFVCPVHQHDVDFTSIASSGLDVEMVYGRAGLAAQRNTLLRAASAHDVILFIDDDFLLAPTYIAEMEHLFATRPDCVVATGDVVADGIKGPGLSVAYGRTLLTAPQGRPTAYGPVFTAYGCNMAVRWSALRDTTCLFDEELPLYAWAEDVDFSRQAARFGVILKSTAMRGVHLGIKSGRVSGVRFGYSQVANQIYLVRKGTIPLGPAASKAFANFLANVFGYLCNGEPHIDRRGRLIGNLLAIADLLRGRVCPQRILALR